MFEPLGWVSEWRSGKCQTWKLSADAMPFKMTLVGGSSERFCTHKIDELNIFKVIWRSKRHCTSLKWMDARAGTISFHTPMSLTPKCGQNAANSDGVPILLWKLPITPAFEVCNEEVMTQITPSCFTLDEWVAYWSVPTHLGRLAVNVMLASGSATLLGFYLVDLKGSFALGFCDQHRSDDSRMTIKTLNEVRINSCRAIL